MRVSLELVPSSSGKLLDDSYATKKFSQINTINIPDLLRFETRSWEATVHVRHHFDQVIPHLRAIDFDLSKPLNLTKTLSDLDIKEVLVVNGDLPQNINHLVYDTTSIELITKLKKELPHLKVYAAIDPYRGSLRSEYTYIQKKLNAGADGFFTQPFFDLRWMEIYDELLKDSEVFFGVAPVLTETASQYWHTKNQVLFPSNFEPTFEWNINHAKKVLNYCEQKNRNIYFMPIKTNVENYLKAIF